MLELTELRKPRPRLEERGEAQRSSAELPRWRPPRGLSHRETTVKPFRSRLRDGTESPWSRQAATTAESMRRHHGVAAEPPWSRRGAYGKFQGKFRNKFWSILRKNFGASFRANFGAIFGTSFGYSLGASFGACFKASFGACFRAI